ncbi:uncharacterized protein DFL_006183 [Arthrobotrys flagrans]|uniref:Rho GDP-dissociation inhibitor n=1 Tax=Arthrobotrys flagrans TaxID=97331 RepID=A0A436ZZN4_ARTFL|nr:hypothetical protein DFL_006183 [Arthrobotrys flagrans]
MADNDELAAAATEGYKVGEKKTLDEYKNLDAEDESLNKWKESLGLGAAIGDPNDPRTVVIEKLSLKVEGRPDIEVDFAKTELATLKSTPFVIKEKAEYRIYIQFRVQHDVISGLKYIQVVKRKGITVDKTEEMLGSYGPNNQKIPFYSKTLPIEVAPDGLLSRGTYNARSRFTDDDKKVHLEFDWVIEIKKDWQ